MSGAADRGTGPRGAPIDLGGGVRVTPFVTATWRTDASPLFGPVPRLLWSRSVGEEADPDERVAMAAVALLIETPEARVLVDPGPGEGWRSAVPEATGFSADGLDALVAAAGTDPVGLVLLSDLRAEHAGAILQADGTPRWPAARIAAQRSEWDAAVRVNDRIASMVDQAAVSVLVVEGAIESIDGDVEIVSSVRVIRTGGFTPGHQVVLVEGRGAGASTFAWFGDLLPRRWHGNPRWVTALDDLPLDSVAAKTGLFGRGAAEGWLTIPAHEPGAPVGRLVPDRDRFRFEVEPASARR